MAEKHTGFALAKMLMDYDVEYIFGIPGGQTLPLYDAGYSKGENLKHVMMRDERSAGHAACVYSRVSGKVGVCDATVGPGATNLPSALGEALNSSTPMLAIVGEHPVNWINKIEFGRASQGIDQISMLKAVTKKVVYVPTQESLPELVKTAFLEATSGRPGPVALVIPADVFRQEGSPASLEQYVNPVYSHYPVHRTVPDPRDIEHAAELLREAKNPVMLVGGGALISGAIDQVRQLAELLTMPVTTTFTGKGVLSDDHPLSLGVVGLFANAVCAEKALRTADLVFIVGSKSSQSSSFLWTVPSPSQKVIHLDIDPYEVGRIFRTDVGLVGDAKLGLEAILKSLKGGGEIHPNQARLEEVRSLKNEWEKTLAERFTWNDAPIKPHLIMAALNRVLGPGDLLVCDAGFASAWGAMYYCQREAGRRCIFPRGLAGLGFSAAAGIGAQLAAPERRVATLAGDGAFTYVMAELAVQAQLNLPIINIVLNNAAYGWVKWAEKEWYQGSFSASDLQSINFVKVAEGLGCIGIRVEEPDQIEGALVKALSLHKPVVLDIITDAASTPN